MTIKNKVQLVGIVTGVPEITTLEDGRSRGVINMVTQENYRNQKGEKVQECVSHRVVVVGKLATIVDKYVTDEVEIGIEGKIITEQFKDASGTDRLASEIHASELLILSKR